MTQWKSKSGSRKRGQKRDGIGVRRMRTFPFLPTPLTTQSLTFRLWSSENQIVGSRSGRISQSQCTFPRFEIGFVLLLLLATPTIWFSLDHKRNVSDGVVSGIGTLLSLYRKVLHFWLRLRLRLRRYWKPAFHRCHGISFSLPLEEKVKYISENETVAFWGATSKGQTFLQCHIEDISLPNFIF